MSQIPLIPKDEINPKMLNYMENKKLYIVLYYGDKNWLITHSITKVWERLQEGHTGKIVVLLATRKAQGKSYDTEIVYDSLLNYIEQKFKDGLDLIASRAKRDVQKETIDYFLRRTPINYESFTTEPTRHEQRLALQDVRRKAI